MGTIQFTERGVAAHARHETRVLAQAAVAALPAPSIFNSQPWRWRISCKGAELHADRARQLLSMDPDGRMLTVSCGIALHHALAALAAVGAQASVERFPEPGDPDFLARVIVTGEGKADPAAIRLASVMSTRRTDRRPFADRVLPEEPLDSVRAAAEAWGAHIHLLRTADVVSLIAATSRAKTIESNDPAYRAEVTAWAQRSSTTPATDGSGTAARTVPLRDFTGQAGQADQEGCDSLLTAVPPIADRTARYAVLFTDGDEASDWLAAGEALSCVLLTATMRGLSASPMSETVEVPITRYLLRTLLGGVGHPIVVVRFGLAAAAEDGDQVPATPRRSANDIIELVEE